jgi:hypothetical protein
MNRVFKGCALLLCPLLVLFVVVGLTLGKNDERAMIAKYGGRVTGSNSVGIDLSGLSRDGRLAIRQLPRFENVSSLDLSRTNVIDDDLKYVSEHVHLQQLLLSGTSIDGSGLQFLNGCSKLERLDLSECFHLSDKGASFIATRPALTVLSVSDTSLGDVTVQQLFACTSLKALDFGGTRITSAGLLGIENLKRLELLDISRTPVNDEGMQFLGELESLRSLYLQSTRVSDEGLAALASCPAIEYLHLGGTDIGDGGIRHLTRFPNLRVVILAMTRVSAAGVSALTECPRLEQVFVDQRLAEDKQMELIRTKNPNLKIDY